MGKHTKTLEKENLAMKKKCAAYDTKAITTIQETQKSLEKIKKLERLCRQLQAERTSSREDKQLLPESA